ncbi:MAG: hypothetical protein H7338_24735 [Candidatus Sericytochromatia bacterium]|nr:hypothetical protein [Candidatus Sericytochromatia bacterium]
MRLPHLLVLVWLPVVACSPTVRVGVDPGRADLQPGSTREAPLSVGSAQPVRLQGTALLAGQPFANASLTVTVPSERHRPIAISDTTTDVDGRYSIILTESLPVGTPLLITARRTDGFLRLLLPVPALLQVQQARPIATLTLGSTVVAHLFAPDTIPLTVVPAASALPGQLAELHSLADLCDSQYLADTPLRAAVATVRQFPTAAHFRVLALASAGLPALGERLRQTAMHLQLAIASHFRATARPYHHDTWQIGPLTVPPVVFDNPATTNPLAETIAGLVTFSRRFLDGETSPDNGNGPSPASSVPPAAPAAPGGGSGSGGIPIPTATASVGTVLTFGSSPVDVE